MYVCSDLFVVIACLLYNFVVKWRLCVLSYVLSLGVVACNHSFLSPRNFCPDLVGFRAFFFRIWSKDSARRRGECSVCIHDVCSD